MAFQCGAQVTLAMLGPFHCDWLAATSLLVGDPVTPACQGLAPFAAAILTRLSLRLQPVQYTILAKSKELCYRVDKSIGGHHMSESELKVLRASSITFLFRLNETIRTGPPIR